MNPLKNLRKILAVIAVFMFFISCKPDSYTTITDGNVPPDLARVMKFLKTQDYANNPSWHLFPGTDVSPASDTLKRLGLPVHGRWVRTYTNAIAFKYLTKVIDSSVSQPFDFPVGSFIVKQNYRSDFDSNQKTISKEHRTLGAITVLYKPDPKYNYCVTDHIDSYNGTDCLGGDWFYGFFFQDDMDKNAISKPSQTVQTNVNTFCVNCHAPAYATDYVRTLDDIVNPFAVASDTPYCDRFDENPTTKASVFNVVKPDNPEQLSKELEDYINTIAIGSDLPVDVPIDPTLVFKYFGAEATQQMFDAYAWKSFIALNWPNKGTNPTTNKPQRGEPNTKLPFTANKNTATVWETYKPTFEVFQPNDVNWNPKDQPWNQKPRTPKGKNCENEDYAFVITMTSKTRDVVNETGQAFAGTFGNLIDQDSSKVRYEVLFNRTEFEYLISNNRAATKNLTPGGPKGEINKVNFPDTHKDTLYKQGSMEIKSAWKELCLTADCNQRDAENLEAAKKKFLVRNALIYEAGSITDSVSSCRIAPMALVGLHIARKTYFAPQWIWITFEHKDNAPDAGQSNPTGTFYNPNLKEPDNCYQLPFLYKNPEVAGCPNVDLNRFVKELANQPNQLTRLVPIDANAQKLNALFQSELKKIDSPFANYILVNTQWPLNGRQQNGNISTLNCKDNGMGNECFTMVPRFLRNTVIESYMSTYCNTANGTPKQYSNRSCMSCHGNAGADLSYIWLDAVSQRVKLQE
ncbi:cytochrome P460 family protein [uncultured Aquimarina sp.]|uniref:cytochrome P460 family protein n=1 Tax=uncultured Aquimarina sp. TaxID=575652 RepID=UPI002624BFA4|nr:cytochrome P460 family protein [uncultured Aquimarina sp.]